MRKHIHVSTDPEFNSFLTEFQEETSRAAAVLARAYLDEKVKQLLLASAVDGTKKCTSLVDGFESPLGSFAARIKAAFSFGLITEEERFDLDQIRDIGNAFAHKLHGLRFDDASIMGKCLSLKCVDEARARAKVALKSYPSTPRERFDLGTALLATYLNRRIANATRVNRALPPLWLPGSASSKSTA
jgi:DNA-binding MltR family transcriptional regulator